MLWAFAGPTTVGLVSVVRVYVVWAFEWPTTVGLVKVGPVSVARG